MRRLLCSILLLPLAVTGARGLDDAPSEASAAHSAAALPHEKRLLGTPPSQMGSVVGAIEKDDTLGSIARDRLLDATVNRLAAEGDPDSLPLLDHLATEGEPSAWRYVTECRTPIKKVWYDYPLHARLARARVLHRAGGAEAALLLDAGANAADFAGFLEDPELDAAQRRGLITALAGTPSVATPLLASHADSQDRGIAGDMVSLASQTGDVPALATLSRGPCRLEAVQALSEVPDPARVEALLQIGRTGSLDVAGAALGGLRPGDLHDSAEAILTELLGDEGRGADAAAALVRIAPDRALAVARQLLAREAGSAVAMRRAVLMLQKLDDEEARTALEGFANRPRLDGDRGQLQGKVATWLQQ